MTNSIFSPSSWTRRVVFSLLALVVVASACGDDGGSAAGGRSFCELALEQDSASDSFDFLSADESSIEAFFRGQRDLLGAGISAAPNATVKSDMETMARGIDQMIDLLEGAGWNIFEVDPAAMDAISDNAEFTDASDRVSNYSDTNCGTTPDTDEPVDDSSGLDDFQDNPDALDAILQSDALRGPMIDSMTADSGMTEAQANCFLDNLTGEGLLDIQVNGLGSSSAAGFIEIFDICGIDPTAFG